MHQPVFEPASMHSLTGPALSSRVQPNARSRAVVLGTVVVVMTELYHLLGQMRYYGHMATDLLPATVPPVPRLVRGYEQVAEHYRQMIRDGGLAPEAKFPSIREIAREWETTPATAARAVRVLAEGGWIEISPRRVAVVIGVPKPPP
jgi:Bacterial regulatory proteins, gntR family